MSSASPVRPTSPRGSGFLLRDELLQAAMRLLADHGDERDVTVRGVARLTGVSATAVYRHFDGSDDLVANVVAEAYRAFHSAILDAIAGPATASERLRAGIAAYLQFADDNPAMYRVVFDRRRPSANPAVRSAADQLFGLLGEQIATALPSTSTPADVRERAIWLWIELHGAATLRPAHPRFAWPTETTLVSQILDRCLSAN